MRLASVNLHDGVTHIGDSEVWEFVDHNPTRRDRSAGYYRAFLRPVVEP